MDFELTDDQVSLQEGLRAFLDGRFSRDDVPRYSRLLVTSTVAGCAGIGCDRRVLSLALPRPMSGSNSGSQEATLVFEELGRALCPARWSPRSSPRRG